MHPMPDRELLIRAERAEAEGFHSLMASIDDHVKRDLGIATTRVKGAPAWSCEAIGWTLFNRTLGLGLYDSFDETALGRIAEFAGGRPHAIEVSPNAATLDIADLERHGYREARRRPKFVRTSEPCDAPQGIEVRAAAPTDQETFADVMVASFGLPPEASRWVRSVVATQCEGRVTVLALADGRPAGTGFLFCSEGIGWLGGGCCLPEFRGRGVQRALIEGRSRMARDLGASWLTSETNADTADDPGYSFRNMIRSGFDHAFDRPQFARE